MTVRQEKAASAVKIFPRRSNYVSYIDLPNNVLKKKLKNNEIRKFNEHLGNDSYSLRWVLHQD